MAGRAGILLAAALALLAGCSLLDPATDGPPPAGTPRVPVPVSALPRAGAVLASVPVGGTPNGLVYDGRHLWVGSDTGSEVVELDPASGRTVRRVRVGIAPLTLAVTAGAVWVADFGSAQVHRLDPVRGRVTAVVPVGRGPVGFAVVGRGLWVANQFDRSVTLIDTATARPVRTVTVARLGVGFPVGGAGSVWLPDLTGSSGAVWRLDPDTGAVLARIPVGSLPSEAVFAFGSMWVTTGQDLVRVDPATGRLLARVGGLGANLDGIAVTPGAVWVGSIRDGTVSRIDPVRNRAVAAMAACPGVRHLAAVGADLWVACPGGGALLRLRPDSI